LRQQIEQQLGEYEVQEETVEKGVALVNPEGFEKSIDLDGTEAYTAEIMYPLDRERLLARWEEWRTTAGEFGFHYPPYNYVEYKGEDGSWHRYTPDFVIRCRNGRSLIVEIKDARFEFTFPNLYPTQLEICLIAIRLSNDRCTGFRRRQNWRRPAEIEGPWRCKRTFIIHYLVRRNRWRCARVGLVLSFRNPRPTASGQAGGITLVEVPPSRVPKFR
jgi:hypothetical protein